MKPIRVYADTSVFGGIYDAEFKKPSELFFQRVKNKVFELVVSPIIQKEIADAPIRVIELFDYILANHSVAVPITPEALDLQKKYIQRRILTPKSENDALHVAVATVSACHLIVSWNFKHIVNFKKIPLYNAVNQLLGYNSIFIYSPLEVINK